MWDYGIQYPISLQQQKNGVRDAVLSPSLFNIYIQYVLLEWVKASTAVGITIKEPSCLH